MFHKIRRIGLFLITGIATINAVSAQTVLKVGENPGKIINKSAVLEVESTTKGVLPPRMTKVQRDAIVSPANGLQVWCTDCNSAGAISSSGELCVYLNNGWTSFEIFQIPAVTTDAVTKFSSNTVNVSGTLVDFFGAKPTETGVVFREIIGNDFHTPPVLDASGNATAPVYKIETDTPVSTANSPIVISISGSRLDASIFSSSVTGGKRPYSFRTYAKNSSGIGYGKTIIFNLAPPVISTPIVTKGNTSTAFTFSGTLTVNAGTPKGTITEYGYCSSTTNSSPTTADNKVALSTGQALDNLNNKLDSTGFTADPTVDLPVNDYTVVNLSKTYFRYYVIANGVAAYSDVAEFTPVDPVTGGTAVATVTGVDQISEPFKTGEAAMRTITVRFNVTKAGTYKRFIAESVSGATAGIIVDAMPGGDFSVGNQELTFVLRGIPSVSQEGNNFVISRLGTASMLRTGAILDKDLNSDALCDLSHPTPVVEITSSRTGRVWMDRNLGASRKAIWNGDYFAFGCLYQWGRGNDGHASISWASNTSGTGINGITGNLSNNDAPHAEFITAHNDSSSQFDWRLPQNPGLWQGVNNVNNPCPASYRIPTISEFENENIPDNKVAKYDSELKLVGFGFRNFINGNIVAEDLGPIYWTSTVGTIKNGDGYTVNEAYSFYTTRNNILTPNADGCSVRCIKDKPIDPITGGVAIATLGTIDEISPKLKIDDVSNSVIKVHFNVSQIGSYDSFASLSQIGATTGLSIETIPAGSFTKTGDNVLAFKVKGTPKTSLDGNIFNISRIQNLSTGKIIPLEILGAIAACDTVHKPTTLLPVTSKTGRIWMDRNLGASRVATSADDKEAFGCLYQWGRGNDGHANINWDTATAVNGTTTTQSAGVRPGNALFITGNDEWRSATNTALWQGLYGGVNNPCPAGYRLPSNAEFTSETSAYGITNTRTAFESPFKFPKNRFRGTDGNVSANSRAFYWTSSITAGEAVSSSDFSFDDTHVEYPDKNVHAYGFAVRCIKGKPNEVVSGGMAVATVGTIDKISAPLEINVASGSFIRVHFNVSYAGSYAAFVPEYVDGATTGISLRTVPAGNFAGTGDQTIDFYVDGTPKSWLDGNTFNIPRIDRKVSTGRIIPLKEEGLNAICDGEHETTIGKVTSVTKKVWMDRNLGASRAATYVKDPEAYGCLYQWGRGNDDHASINWESSTSGTPVHGTIWTLSDGDTPANAEFIISNSGGSWRTTPNDNLWNNINGKNINNPCPPAYRVPTSAEMQAEINAYSIDDMDSAYTSALKLVPAGSRRFSDGTLVVRGSDASPGYSGAIWTTSDFLLFKFRGVKSPSDSFSSESQKSFGRSVRCIQN